MWPWHYGMEEAASLLEEHDYFKVLEARRVLVDEQGELKAVEEIEAEKQREAEFYRRKQNDPTSRKISSPENSLSDHPIHPW